MTPSTLVYTCWILRQVARFPLYSTKPPCELSSDSGCVQMSWVPSAVLPSWWHLRHGAATEQVRSVAAHLDRAQDSLSPVDKWKTLLLQGLFLSVGKKHTLAPLSGGLVLELALDIIQGKPVKTSTQEKHPFGFPCRSQLQGLYVAAWRTKDTSGTFCFNRFMPDRAEEEFFPLETLSGESLSGAFTRWCAKRGFPTCGYRRLPYCLHKKS